MEQHQLKSKGSKSGQYKFDDDFNTIMTQSTAPTTAPNATRFTTYENSDQVQFQLNPTAPNGTNNNPGHDYYTIRCQKKKLSSKLCNPVIILSVVSLTAVAGALFSTFYLIHSLKPASTFIDHVNGVIESKEMKEVDGTVNSFLKNATNWVKQNIGGKKNETDPKVPKKKSGEMVIFGEGNGFSLNSLANLAGQIIKSVNDTISSLSNNKTNTSKGIEGGSGQQSLTEKSAISTQDGSEPRMVTSESEADEDQKVYHMS